MSRLFAPAFILACVLGFHAAAMEPVSCAPDLSSRTAPAAAKAKHAALSEARAEEIVGEAPLGDAKSQVRRAVSYILSLKEASFDEKIEDLNALFGAVRRLQLFTWKSDKFYGPDQSAGFVGDQGFFVILHRDGRLFKGTMRIERDLNDRFEWNGRYDTMSEVRETDESLRQAFIDEFAGLIFAGEAQNQAWIDDALKELAAGDIHVLIENSWMKKLNDKVLKNKDFVTALTNFHKKLFLDELAKLALNLKTRPYQDFKSTRLTLSPPVDSAKLAELEAAFRRANQNFYSSPRLKAVLRADDMKESWFRMGVGQSETQAALAARDARDHGNSGGVSYYWDPKVSARFTEKLQRAKSLNAQILERLKGTALLARDRDGLGPALEVFTAARKATPADFLPTLEQIYPGAGLDQNIALMLLEYATLADEFSPSILVAKRELLTIEEAPYGAFSLDFIGLGAENLRSTARALVKAKDLNDAARLTRAFEREVTRAFNARKEMVRAAVDEYFAGQVSMRFSGDDGIIIPQREIALRDQLGLIQKLSLLMPKPYFRMTMINAEGAAHADSSQLITHAESMEKVLRQVLLRDLGPERLGELSLGVFIAGTSNERKVFLMMGVKKTLDESEKKKIRYAFPGAVKIVEDQIRAQGLPIEYEPVEIFAIFGKKN
jgi:hypothetical protein